MFTRFIGWLLGLERLASVERVRLGLGAEWATRGSGPFWLCLGAATIALLVFVFYAKYQQQGSRRARLVLATGRTILFLLLLVTLAEPLLHITVSRLELPRLLVLFDGTASMGLRDHYSAEQLAALAKSTGLQANSATSERAPTRQDYVAAWLTRSASSDTSADGAPADGAPADGAAGVSARHAGALLEQLSTPTQCRMQVFIFDGQTRTRVRELSRADRADTRIDWKQVAAELRSTGQVTGLGTVLRDLSRQGGRRRLAGVIIVSDFVQNSGEHPLGSSNASVTSPLEQLGVPVYTIGVGAARSRDLAVQIQPDAKIRRGEMTTINVRIQQTQLRGETAQLRLTAQTRSGGTATESVTEIDAREITLDSDRQLVEIPYLPRQAGEVELRAEVTVLPGETVTANNRSVRRIQVIDDFIRLLYVAYEPTWEWRFVKEVFHRDPAVGMRGFRTYLASSDPRVRESNPLFLPTLAQQPKDFFANDVVFLDDLPKTVLTPRFCAMLEKFVRDLGGGLVFIAGPRFGPQTLLDTPFAKMLPVIIDPKAQLRDQHEFALQLTARADEFSFMHLDDDPQLNAKAWSNLGHLPWYQPVANKHERAIVLAQHPTDTCLDGRTPQPLIAIRRYGAGEVVYVGFNETWRLRRLYGDKYYRRFWLPMIDRLGLSHALGARKRFVVRMDRRQYRIEDDAIVTVHAYDENYEPLDPGTLKGEALEAQLFRIKENGEAEQVDTLRIGAVRPGLFESRFPVLTEGTYRIRVNDPILQSSSRQSFRVTGASAELRSSVRNETLQHQLARRSRGASCVLSEADSLKDQIKLVPYRETEEHNFAIWKTPLWFMVIVSLMLGEWLLRKWVNLV